MQNLTFETPVWVRYRKGRYVVRPLLAGPEEYAHERLEQAFRNLSNAVRREYFDRQLEAEEFDQLLWYTFDPEVKFEVLELHFDYGRRSFSGHISAYWFEVQGMTVIGLPALGNDLFISSVQQPGRSELAEEVITRLQHYVRIQKKRIGHDFVLDESVQTIKGEYLAKVELSLQVRSAPIGLQADDGDVFQQFFQQQAQFDGGYELEKVGSSLNRLFPESLSRAYYEEEIVGQLSKLIFGEDKVPVVLIGPRRVGKTTLLHEALFRYLDRNTSTEDVSLQSQLWEVDPTRIIAGMSIIGMWQRRMEAIIRFVMQPDAYRLKRQDKLYFKNVIALFRIGKSGQNNMTLSDLLKPYLQNRQVQVILEATPEEWDVASELDRGFTDLFKVVRIQEPGDEGALRIIGKLRMQTESKARFEISNPALWRLVELQKRFYRQEALVGRVTESFRQLASKYTGRSIDTQTILEEFSAQTHLDPRFANSDYLADPQEFYEHFAARLIGQSEAVSCLVEVLHCIKAQLNDPDKPFGSVLFIGPTGVGKTLAAKELATYLFTHEDSLVRFDMNEYIDDSAVNRLVGDFYNPEGQLTSKIRYNPYCVLLFDEIEKAHPDVHNLLLQVLGEGRLTDSLGRTVSFRNTVIIMTSNLGADRVGKEINPTGREEVATSTYRKAVMDFFRPEFINRIDQVVIFNRLKAEHIARIAWLQINELLRRHGFVRRHTILRVSPEALESLALRGFDPNLGGRALKRQIEKEMTALLAEQLVTIRPNYPIIFHLVLQDQRLKPLVITLEPVAGNPAAWVPNHSEAKIRKEEIELLMERLTEIKEDMLLIEEEEAGSFDILEALQEDEGLDVKFHLKDELQQLEGELQRILWDYSIRRKMKFDAQLYQMRTLLPQKGGVIPEDFLGQDNLSEGDQVQERLKELYHKGYILLPEQNARYFSLAQRVSWLDYFFYQYGETGMDHLLIYIGTQMVPKGIKFHQARYIIDYLSSQYHEVFPVEEVYQPENYTQVLYLRGPGLFQLFQQEVGIHLAFVPPNPPIPVEVKVHKLEKGEDRREAVRMLVEKAGERGEGNADIPERQVLPVVRMYSFEEVRSSGPNRNPGYFLDYRTGMMNRTDLEPEDFRLLFFANFPDTYKINLDEHA